MMGIGVCLVGYNPGVAAIGAVFVEELKREGFSLVVVEDWLQSEVAEDVAVAEEGEDMSEVGELDWSQEGAWGGDGCRTGCCLHGVPLFGSGVDVEGVGLLREG